MAVGSMQKSKVTINKDAINIFKNIFDVIFLHKFQDPKLKVAQLIPIIIGTLKRDMPKLFE